MDPHFFRRYYPVTIKSAQRESDLIMKGKNIRPFDYYALLFFTTAFAGWLWEVLLYLVTAHTFVNRGVYMGPYLPIYGTGCVLLILLLHRLRRHPVSVFALSCILCTALEYFSGVWLEWKWGIRWWDYSGHMCNVNGHICPTSSVGFGLGGMLLICVFQPVFNRYYHRLTIAMRAALCVVFTLIFTADAAYSAMKPHTGELISTLRPCIFAADRLLYRQKLLIEPESAVFRQHWLNKLI